MGPYALLVFVHVLAAATWFGAALLSLVLLGRGIRAEDRSWVLRYLEHDDAISPALYVPAALLTLATGVAMVATSGWSFHEHLWTSVGLGVFVIVFALGIAVFLPAGARLRAAIDEHGPESPEVSRELRRLHRFSHVDVVLLGAAVFFMTVKPF